jgi:hypothetical protein
VCLLAAGLGGIPVIGAVISAALCLTVPKVYDLAPAQQCLFAVAATAGPICFLYMYKIGAWCAPYRYLWHCCCGALISVAGALNANV